MTMVTIIPREEFDRLRIPPVYENQDHIPQLVYVTQDIPVKEDTIVALKYAQSERTPLPNVAMCYKNGIVIPAKDTVRLFARPHVNSEFEKIFTGLGKKSPETRLDDIITFNYTPHAIAFGKVEELSDPDMNTLFGFDNLRRYLIAKKWLDDVNPACDDMWFTAYAGTPDYDQNWNPLKGERESQYRTASSYSPALR
jgi:hypothetical protein